MEIENGGEGLENYAPCVQFVTLYYGGREGGRQGGRQAGREGVGVGETGGSGGMGEKENVGNRTGNTERNEI